VRLGPLFLVFRKYFAYSSLSLTSSLKGTVSRDWRGLQMAHYSAENPASEINLGLKRVRNNAIFEQFNLKTELKLKMKVTVKYFGLLSDPKKPTIWSSQSHETTYRYIKSGMTKACIFFALFCLTNSTQHLIFFSSYRVSCTVFQIQ
jgi:hypothetical protein